MRDARLVLLATAAEEGTGDAVALARRHPSVRRTRLPTALHSSPLDIACDAAVTRLYATITTVEQLRTADPAYVGEIARDLAQRAPEVATLLTALARSAS